MIRHDGGDSLQVQPHEKGKQISAKSAVDIVKTIFVLNVHDIWVQLVDDVKNVLRPARFPLIHRSKNVFLSCVPACIEIRIADDVYRVPKLLDCFNEFVRVSRYATKSRRIR
jgi:hypothetical protein